MTSPKVVKPARRAADGGLRAGNRFSAFLKIQRRTAAIYSARVWLWPLLPSAPLSAQQIPAINDSTNRPGPGADDADGGS